MRKRQLERAEKREEIRKLHELKEAEKKRQTFEAETERLKKEQEEKLTKRKKVRALVKQEKLEQRIRTRELERLQFLNRKAKLCNETRLKKRYGLEPWMHLVKEKRLNMNTENVKCWMCCLFVGRNARELQKDTSRV